MKSADGKVIDNDLIKKLKNETIIVQKNNCSLENIEIQQKLCPVTQ